MNCHEFEGLLESVLDGALVASDHARCVDHVASCVSCRDLVEPMGPNLTPYSVEPPASLFVEVVSRTSGASWRRTWGEVWHQWMLRPRFASEAAYVGVVVLSLISTTVNSRAVINDLRSEAGILLDRATSLLAEEKP